ncbi:MarR family winged helix-turn-helix transcriptional regulator [Roseinatronobacter bogoriensis]|uniref:MarR family transcriptional regulator n=1 Tax=Roseinatronobacter bogoriensis subsp. barguzinensis TaxID=441209 RepID=A0A2K8K5A1_9RHOB|nr:MULTISPECIES: MarR family transcriptional regulator [Rhodobaca]ATX64634.1 MarR family transcriptional regulator [Rhodobaca barguzinensis]MBB4209533.1 DNA-binding MarR family transcriptional regulator [Rhodobaca bogoriensis DSM 18756]TDW35102.1 DNA-binding MarR family transcriptional regulator [Rhodobaca barguzinensis]TDY66889.1 MarR family transcriptional regulator [Rhodobaca bogoriensis DSM 18756]
MRNAPQQVFDLECFLPYLLNQAAEASSRSFATVYREEFGMTRTQWRVMANLGKFGGMTASEICQISHIEKTKVSRAVGQLQEIGYLMRSRAKDDKRRENLSLTPSGQEVFRKLGARGLAYQAQLAAALGAERLAQLEAMLQEVRALHPEMAGLA